MTQENTVRSDSSPPWQVLAVTADFCVLNWQFGQVSFIMPLSSLLLTGTESVWKQIADFTVRLSKVQLEKKVRVTYVDSGCVEKTVIQLLLRAGLWLWNNKFNGNIFSTKCPNLLMLALKRKDKIIHSFIFYLLLLIQLVSRVLQRTFWTSHWSLNGQISLHVIWTEGGCWSTWCTSMLLLWSEFTCIFWHFPVRLQ